MDTLSETVRRWFECGWNQRDRACLREIMHPEVSGQVEGSFLRGPDDFLVRMFEPFIAAFPDLRIDVRGIVREGDEVMIRWTVRGTQLGPFGPIPASGLRVEFRGMTWQRYQDGRMIEGEDSWDMQALVQALQSGVSVGSTSVL
jgi:steroid delta-isomerase-like uncharacterized protein